MQTIGFRFMDGKKVIEYAGTSTDTKPTGGNLATGSIFTEVDTGDVYFYDATSTSWIKQFSFQG